MKRIAILLLVLLLSTGCMAKFPFKPIDGHGHVVEPEPYPPNPIISSIPFNSYIPYPSPTYKIQTPTVPKKLRVFRNIDVNFLDEKVGWALGMVAWYPWDTGSEQSLQLRFTSDGGETWGSLPVPGFPIIDNQGAVSHIQFLNARDGWAYNPDLYTTRDGGYSWEKDEIEGEIITMVTLEDRALAISQQCQQVEQCVSILWEYQDGKGWYQAQTQPDFPGRGSQLVTDGKSVWLLEQELSVNLVYIQVSLDKGQSWDFIPVPDQYFGTSFMLRVNPQGDLWLLGRGVGATAMMDKYLYVSTDNGKSWDLRAQTGILKGAGMLHNLPATGYAPDMSIVSPAHAFIAGGSWSRFIRTLDGGRTWDDFHSEENGRDSPTTDIGSVYFVDDLYGWALSQTIIYRTMDGGLSWERIEIQ